MRTCEFCGQETDRGSNEHGEFACVSCFVEFARMLPPAKMPA
jgi:hypothetical protein